MAYKQSLNNQNFKMKIIGINGKISSGKSTMSAIIKSLLENQNIQIEEKMFAFKLKQIVSILTGCEIKDLENQEFKNKPLGEEWYKFVSTKSINDIPIGPDMIGIETKYEVLTYRSLLQKIGTEAMRDCIHENIWVNALSSDLKEDKNYVISDMRFPNELQAIKDRGGITIRITRPGTAVGTHPSETALDNSTFDYEILNDGSISDLIEKVKIILQKENIIK